MSGDYVNPFSQASQVYGYHPYNGAQYQGYSPYSQQFGLGTGQFFNNTFGHQTAQGYDASTQEQTISPSALQNEPVSDPTQTQTPLAPALAPKGAGQVPQHVGRRYDDSLAASIANGMPAGIERGATTVKDAMAVSKAMDSKKFAGAVFIGTERFVSDEQRGISAFPRVTARRSLKEMKRQVLAKQGDSPWTAGQRPLLKRLKLKSAVPRPTRPLSGTADASSESSTDPSSDEASDIASDSEDETESHPPAVLAQSRPSDALKGFGYDITRVVWSPRRVNGPAIRTALGKYWELVKPVRDDWKHHISAVQVAEAKQQKKEDIERHKTLANEKRKMLDHAFHMTVEYGHSDIVEK